jgi:hypothetical protein
METWSLWLAAAPIAVFIILLTPFPGMSNSRRAGVWIGAVAALFFGTSYLAQCGARAVAISDIEHRLFGGPDGQVVVYDTLEGKWLTIAAGPTAPDRQPAEIRLVSRSGLERSNRGGTQGSASPAEMGPVQVQVGGTRDEVRRLNNALQIVASSRYGSAVLSDVLRQEDVYIAFSDEIGVDLPNGARLTTGGTAVTFGHAIHLSRQHYGDSSDAVLAAMVAHELTHVVQNQETHGNWWEWPWATIDREITAHLVQAIVWAEVRGDERDPEQDFILNKALDRERLRHYIKQNPAYPWWLAPDIAC